ncbi:MAG TPA: transglycosylase SLT domain-containing protein [Candidatus Cybelea sp.]
MDFVKFNDPQHPQLMQHQSDILYASGQANIPSCLLAAIVWRESGGQNVLQKGVKPGPGCGVGLSQITSGVDWADINDPKFQGYQLLQPADNLYVAANYFLKGLVQSAENAEDNNLTAFRRCCRGQIIFAAACGYNAGWGAVSAAMNQGVDADTMTTNDYGADVLAKYITLVNDSHGNP